MSGLNLGIDATKPFNVTTDGGGFVRVTRDYVTDLPDELATPWHAVIHGQAKSVCGTEVMDTRDAWPVHTQELAPPGTLCSECRNTLKGKRNLFP
jgi:hypothetical protein